MKSHVKFRLALSFALMCFLSGCYLSFNNWEEPPVEPPVEPSIETEPGKITAQGIQNFAHIIATDGDHVLVSSFDQIHIFRYTSPGIELIQTIESEPNSRMISMTVYRSELVFGLLDGNGTGIVYVYTRNGEAWELSQEIRKGRRGDNFGCAIDIEGETMVVGANAIWNSCDASNACEGRVYVFGKNEGVWEETQEIQADQSETYDWFGTCVAICGDLLLAGSPLLPMHVYQFNGEWELLRTEQIGACTIAHSENNFMVTGEFDAWAFNLEPDGSFSENIIHSLEKKYISWSGDNFEMRDSLAIVNTEYDNCYLLKYGNRQWNIEKVFSPDPGESCDFEGKAFTDQYAIIGGSSYDCYLIGYVYFRDL